LGNFRLSPKPFTAAVAAAEKKTFSYNSDTCCIFSLEEGLLKKRLCNVIRFERIFVTGNTKGGSITVPLTSCLTGLKLAV
jgi:hypothetical protein